MKNQSLGELIIDTVVRANALQSAVAHPDGSFTFVWSANSAEQIEAAVMEKLAAYKMMIDQL